jgi:hypothetical protein
VIRLLVRGLTIWVALWPGLASAITCEPKMINNPGGTGSRVVARVLPLGEWRYVWCPVPGKVYPDGRVSVWRFESHACLRKYCATPEGLTAALWAAAMAPNWMEAANAAMARAEIKPQGAQEEFEFAQLKYAACLDASTPPYIVDVAPLPANWCGPAPVLAVPPPVWVVAPNTSSTTTPPTRPMWDATGTKAVAERAVVGAACNCAAPVIKTTQTLCRLAAPAASNNVTACVK